MILSGNICRIEIFNIAYEHNKVLNNRKIVVFWYQVDYVTNYLVQNCNRALKVVNYAIRDLIFVYTLKRSNSDTRVHHCIGEMRMYCTYSVLLYAFYAF